MKDIKEITEKLEKGVKEIFASDKYKAYLDTMAKFYKYSVNNSILIWCQRPDATYVASYNAWKKNFNRQVMKGEKAIKIIAPIPHKKETVLADGTKEEKEWMSYMAVNVFDISQTEGEELPKIVDKLTGDVEQYNNMIDKLTAVAPVPVEWADLSINGMFSPGSKKISINNGMSQKQTIKTLIHEIAHSMLHADGAEEEKAGRNKAEVQAESVAYTVCKYLGIDTEEYSFGYVAGWSEGKEIKELTESMEVIRKTAKTIIEAIAE